MERRTCISPCLDRWRKARPYFDTATSLPTGITTRFENADAILLIDDTSQPVLATWDICSENLRRRKPLLNEHILDNQAEKDVFSLSVGEKQDKEYKHMQYSEYDYRHTMLCQVSALPLLAKMPSKVYAAL
jgi:hypothetical protein